MILLKVVRAALAGGARKKQVFELQYYF